MFYKTLTASKEAINLNRNVEYANVFYLYGSVEARAPRIIQELFNNYSRIIQESSFFSLDNYTAMCSTHQWQSNVRSTCTSQASVTSVNIQLQHILLIVQDSG